MQQYGSPYDPYTSCSPRLQSTAYTSTSGTSAANTANASGIHQETTAVYVTGDALPPLASSSSSSLSTSTAASYTRYEVVPSSYATTHAIRSSSSSSKVLTVDLPSPDSGIGADAVTPRQDHHAPTALHQVTRFVFSPFFIHSTRVPRRPIETPLLVSNFGRTSRRRKRSKRKKTRFSTINNSLCRRRTKDKKGKKECAHIRDRTYD